MPRRIGEILVSEGRLSERALARALELQRTSGGRGTRLGAILLKWDLLAEADLLDALAKVHRCPAVDWSALASAKRETARLLSPEQAVRLGALPYAAENKTVRVAFVNPSNLAAVDEVSAITGRRVVPAVTTEVRMMQAHQRFYSRPLSRDVWSIVQKLEAKSAPVERPAASDAPARSDAAPASADPLDATPAPDLSEVADSLLPMVEDFWEVADPAPQPESRGEEDGLDAPVADALPNPLTDDGPLSEFVAEVLTYFASRSDLDSALQTIAENDAVENLDSSLESPESGDDAPNFDSTLPSGIGRRTTKTRRPN